MIATAKKCKLSQIFNLVLNLKFIHQTKKIENIQYFNYY